MILTIGRIFNHSIFIISFIILLQVHSLDLLLLPDNLTYNDPIGYISNILYTDIRKQYALSYYIYNK